MIFLGQKAVETMNEIISFENQLDNDTGCLKAQVTVLGTGLAYVLESSLCSRQEELIDNFWRNYHSLELTGRSPQDLMNVARILWIYQSPGLAYRSDPFLTCRAAKAQLADAEYTELKERTNKLWEAGTD